MNNLNFVFLVVPLQASSLLQFNEFLWLLLGLRLTKFASFLAVDQTHTSLRRPTHVVSVSLLKTQNG